MQWRNAVGGVLGTSVVKRYTGHTGGTWDRALATLVPPVGTAQASVKMVVGGLTGTIDVDDVSLRP